MFYHRTLSLFKRILQQHWAIISLIAFGSILRIILISQNWPILDSDEAIMGLMTQHIVAYGEHPTFFYGQNYMGSTEAFVSAGLFKLFGPSTFALRLSLILFFTIFLISIYCLISLLFSKNFALFTVFLLSLGNENMFWQETRAVGGYPEVLLFGSLAFALAAWLALTSRRKQPAPYKRALLFFCWGLASGLGIFSHLVIVPIILTAGLLLFIGCWHEWRTLALPCVLAGLFIGVFPLIYYNLHAAPGQDSISVFLNIHSSGQTNNLPFINQIKGTFLVSLPLVTGISPPCQVTNNAYVGFLGPYAHYCLLIYTSWGASFILLWTVAVLLAVFALWKLRPTLFPWQWSDEKHAAIVLLLARLLLLSSSALTLYFYLNSPTSATGPTTNYRYLDGLLISLPAVISPLWVAATRINRVYLLNMTGKALLTLLALVFLIGTVNACFTLPQAQQTYQQRTDLIDSLQHFGVKHFYSDYWTCYALAFQSHEQLTCAVVNDQEHLQLQDNRYTPYIPITQADPRAAYVLTSGTPGAKLLAQYPHLYHHFTRDGYEIYLPI